MTCPSWTRPIATALQSPAGRGYVDVSRAIVAGVSYVVPLATAPQVVLADYLASGCRSSESFWRVLGENFRRHAALLTVVGGPLALLFPPLAPFLALAVPAALLLATVADDAAAGRTPSSATVARAFDIVGQLGAVSAAVRPDLAQSAAGRAATSLADDIRATTTNTRTTTMTTNIRRGSIRATVLGARNMMPIPSRDVVNDATKAPIVQTPEEIATALFSAAQTLVSTRGDKVDLRGPFIAQVAAEMAAIDALEERLRSTMQGVLAVKVTMNGGGRSYLRSVAASNLPAPWSLDDVAAVLNDPAASRAPVTSAPPVEDVGESEPAPTSSGAATIIGGAIIGGLAGGPIGAAVGAALGAAAGRMS